MIQIARRTCWLFVGWLAIAAPPSSALGQGNTFNPYGNSGYADYREFATPIYSNDPSLPGQARLQAQPLGERPNRSNQFEQYFDKGEELGAGAASGGKRGISAPGVPYYRTFRQYDDQYNRTYTPNNTKADRDFNTRLRQREERYAAALRETDPAKRARLIRQINEDSLTATRAPAPARASAKGASGSAAAKAKAGTNTPRASAPPPPGSGPVTRATPSAGTVPYPRGLDPSLMGTAPRTKAARPKPAATPAPATTTPAIPAPG